MRPHFSVPNNEERVGRNKRGNYSVKSITMAWNEKRGKFVRQRKNSAGNLRWRLRKECMDIFFYYMSRRIVIDIQKAFYLFNDSCSNILTRGSKEVSTEVHESACKREVRINVKDIDMYRGLSIKFIVNKLVASSMWG